MNRLQCKPLPGIVTKLGVKLDPKGNELLQVIVPHGVV
jgi:hypothetical protein